MGLRGNDQPLEPISMKPRDEDGSKLKRKEYEKALRRLAGGTLHAPGVGQTQGTARDRRV